MIGQKFLIDTKYILVNKYANKRIGKCFIRYSYIILYRIRKITLLSLFVKYVKRQSEHFSQIKAYIVKNLALLYKNCLNAPKLQVFNFTNHDINDKIFQ